MRFTPAEFEFEVKGKLILEEYTKGLTKEDAMQRL
jgi:hypothetical protein